MEFKCPPIANRLLEKCRLFNNREDIVEALSDDLVIAEVGVLAGDFSQLLLKKASRLYLIDRFDAEDWPHMKRFNHRSHYHFVKHRFLSDPRVRLMKGDSSLMLESFDDQSLDVIYMDADHSYDNVSKTLAIAHRKLKKNGLLWINDYTTYDPHLKVPYGVQRATNEIVNKYQMEVVYFALNNSNFHDIAVRKTEHVETACEAPAPVRVQRIAGKHPKREPYETFETSYGHITLYRNDMYITGTFLRGQYWDIDNILSVRQYIDPRRNILEIGGHCGTSTLVYASYLDDQAKCFVYEPQVKLYQLLQLNIEQNGLSDRVMAYQSGVFCFNGSAQMSDNDIDGDKGSVSKRYTSETKLPCNFGGISLGPKGETIQVVTIDEMKHDNIGFIHCDAQGSENFIFSKAIKTITEHRPVILFENNYDHDTQFHDNVVQAYPQYREESLFDIKRYCLDVLKYTKCIDRFNNSKDCLIVP